MDQEHGDYIELTDVAFDTPVLEVITGLLRPAFVEEREGQFPLLVLDQRIEVFLDEHTEDCPPVTRLAIGDRGDARGRRSAARQVYTLLVEHTNWTLLWTADDAPDIIDRRELTSA